MGPNNTLHLPPEVMPLSYPSGRKKKVSSRTHHSNRELRGCLPLISNGALESGDCTYQQSFRDSASEATHYVGRIRDHLLWASMLSAKDLCAGSLPRE